MEGITLSNILQSARDQQDLPLEEVEARTGIKKCYLKALEKGLHDQLPPATYVTGYLKALAKVYQLDAGDLVKVYKHEINYSTHYKADSSIDPRRSFHKSFHITPKVLGAVIFFALFASISVYMLWQIQHVTAAPRLEVINPLDNQQITSNHILVSGRTEPGSSVTINNQATAVEPDGSFSQTVFVGPGENQVIIRSENRFSRYSEVTKTIIVAPNNY